MSKSSNARFSKLECCFGHVRATAADHLIAQPVFVHIVLRPAAGRKVFVDENRRQARVLTIQDNFHDES